MPRTALKKIARIPERLSEISRDTAFLANTDAPSEVYQAYFRNVKNRSSLSRYEEQAQLFRTQARAMRFDKDWFTYNIPYWLDAFNTARLFDRPVAALEIGSWQGMSSFFILKTLPKAHLTCVDTWEGADEHVAEGSAHFNRDIASGIQQDFDTNLSPFADRLTKFRGTSLSYFASHSEKLTFDLVYIDGSHHCDDVVVDAMKGFDKLRPGGLMIFDDYFFRYYKRALDNPASAINFFLKMKRGSYKILSLNWQLVLLKS